MPLTATASVFRNGDLPDGGRARGRGLLCFGFARARSDMLDWQNSGFSIDASVRIALADRDVLGYFKSLEHLVRY